LLAYTNLERFYLVRDHLLNPDLIAALDAKSCLGLDGLFEQTPKLAGRSEDFCADRGLDCADTKANITLIIDNNSI